MRCPRNGFNDITTSRENEREAEYLLLLMQYMKKRFYGTRILLTASTMLEFCFSFLPRTSCQPKHSNRW